MKMCFQDRDISSANQEHFPTWHLDIALGTCCEMEGNAGIAFALQGHSWAPGHAVGRAAVGARATSPGPPSTRLREVTNPR